MLFTVLVTFLVFRLSFRATAHLMMGLTLALAAAYFACEHYMDAATSAHLDHTITLCMNAAAHVVCSLFDSAQCATTVHWLSTPARLALKPLLYWTVVLMESVMPRVATWWSQLL